jgi:hypothetical protein
MDKVEYVDWPTQNVDIDETYTYSCLYHWIEERLYSIKYLYRYICCWILIENIYTWLDSLTWRKKNVLIRSIEDTIILSIVE